MDFNLGMRITERIIIRCHVCGSDPHAEGCPVPRLEKLSELNRHIECPVCHAHEVGINAVDYYECRSCHVQFTSGAGTLPADDKIHYLDDPKAIDLVPVRRLPNGGNGDFPLDKSIMEVRDEIKRLTAKKRKRGTKKRKK